MFMVSADDTIAQRALQAMQRKTGGEIIGDRLIPLAGHLGELVADPQLQCRVEGNWFAVCTEPRQQKLASQSIAEAGLPAYLPMISKVESHGRGRERTVERPMFGQYLFVRCRPIADDWNKVTSARGVQRLLATTGNGQPLPLRDGELEVIRLHEAEASTLMGRTKLVWHFSPGDVVRIKDGPFAAFYAQLESAVDEHGRIKALVDIFARSTPVEFDATQLEAL